MNKPLAGLGLMTCLPMNIDRQDLQPALLILQYIEWNDSNSAHILLFSSLNKNLSEKDGWVVWIH